MKGGGRQRNITIVKTWRDSDFDLEKDGIYQSVFEIMADADEAFGIPVSHMLVRRSRGTGKRRDEVTFLNMVGGEVVFPKWRGAADEDPDAADEDPWTNGDENPPIVAQLGSHGQQVTYFGIYPNRENGARRTTGAPRSAKTIKQKKVDAGIKLTWHFNEGSHKTEWEVEVQDHGSAGAQLWSAARVEFAETSACVVATVKGLVGGRMYSFRVRGGHAGQTSEWAELFNINFEDRSNGPIANKRRISAAVSPVSSPKPAKKAKEHKKKTTAKASSQSSGQGQAAKKRGGDRGNNAATTAVAAPLAAAATPAAAVAANPAPPASNAVVVLPPVPPAAVPPTAVAVASAPAAPQADAPVTTLGECTVCMDAAINMVYVPCGHSALCSGCVARLQPQASGCTICRQPVEQVLQLTLDDRNREDGKCSAGFLGCTGKRDCVFLDCRCFEMCCSCAGNFNKCPVHKVEIRPGRRQQVF